MNKRHIYGILSIMLFSFEILIGLFASGWIRNYLGDVLVVILLYTLIRSVRQKKNETWYAIPTSILVLAFAVEFLQLWGFCDRLGITNKLLRIIIGTGFAVEDLVAYIIGIVPCYLVEYSIELKENQRSGLFDT